MRYARLAAYYRAAGLFLIVGALPLSLTSGGPAAALTASAAAAQTSPPAFPSHTGFPRTEPIGKIDFASPAVADLNGDGRLDILVADSEGCLWAWDHTGAVVVDFQQDCAGERIIGPIVVGEIDGEPSSPEVAAGTRGSGEGNGQRGKVYVWNSDGSVVPGWPIEMMWNTAFATGDNPEVYSVVLADLTGDSKLEVLAGTSNNASNTGGVDSPTNGNVYAWHPSGASLGPGFPAWYQTAGIYGMIGAADVDGNGPSEIVVVRDHRYLNIYTSTGATLIPAINTWITGSTGEYLEFTNNAPSMGDLDGDGTVEIVVAGKVKDTGGSNKNKAGLLVFEPDGSRRAGWSSAKLHGTPLSDSFRPSMAPALADLDGDGVLEIVVAMFDGKLRVYNAGGSLRWEYDYAQGKTLFASEPAIGDITGDGKVDIIFGTYSPEQNYNADVRVIGLDSSGQMLSGFPLALDNEGAYAGLRGAPTLADVDDDCQVELLAASWGGAVYMWDLSAPFRPDKTPWPTARHDLHRSGNYATNPAISAAAAFSVPLPNAAELTFKAFLPIVSICG